MHEAVFQLNHHSVYANATKRADVNLRMWCGRHADLLYFTGRDVREALEMVEKEVPLAEVIEDEGELVAVTEGCLLSHQDDLLEKHLEEHNCLTFYPVKYSDGDLFARVFSLERGNLSAFFHSVGTEYNVDVVSISEIEAIGHYPALMFNSDMPDFSKRQREAITRAFEMGYYQIPRETTTEEIAGKLEINRRTLEEHLRRAEKKAVESLLKMNQV